MALKRISQVISIEDELGPEGDQFGILQNVRDMIINTYNKGRLIFNCTSDREYWLHQFVPDDQQVDDMKALLAYTFVEDELIEAYRICNRYSKKAAERVEKPYKYEIEAAMQYMTKKIRILCRLNPLVRAEQRAMRFEEAVETVKHNVEDILATRR